MTDLRATEVDGPSINQAYSDLPSSYLFSRRNTWRTWRRKIPISQCANHNGRTSDSIYTSKANGGYISAYALESHGQRGIDLIKSTGSWYVPQ